MRAISHTTIRCCFATHSFTINLTIYNLYVIYIYNIQFIGHSVFVFLLEISIDNCQTYPLGKIHNHRSFLISCSSTIPPIISSSLCFLRPHVHLGPHLELPFHVWIHTFYQPIQVLRKITFLPHAVVNLWSIRAYYSLRCQEIKAVIQQR